MANSAFRLCLFLLCALGALISTPVFAQDTVEETGIDESVQAQVVKAEVVDITDERVELLPSTTVERTVQTIRVLFLEGNEKGQYREIENDFYPIEEGDKVFVRVERAYIGEGNTYGIIEIERTMPLIVLGILFALVVIGLGGLQGVRALLSLAASLFIILYLLVPALVSGLPPVITSIAIAVPILFGAVFFTHGFSRRSLVAFCGTIVTVLITAILAYVFTVWTKLSGFHSDEAVYLNLNTGGTLDFAGLLLGAIIIGVLGVLDDIATTQVAVVEELHDTDKDMSRKKLFTRALRVGREHSAALVNTLVLAYTSASLPLLLWVKSADSSFSLEANGEIFAAEIVRALVGSIGLVLAVPITTLLAVWALKFYEGRDDSHRHPHHHQ